MKSGAVRVECTGVNEDSLVVPRKKPFIRSVFEVALIHVRTDAPTLTGQCLLGSSRAECWPTKASTN